MRERLESMAARVRVGSNRQFALLPTAWIDGEAKEFRLAHEGREVDVHSLERKKRLYPQPSYSRVDAGIELLEPLASGAPPMAVASGWAAFEALLSELGNHALVADRMGAITGCSFPRAELTNSHVSPSSQGRSRTFDKTRCLSDESRPLGHDRRRDC